MTGVAATFLIALAISLIHMFPYDLSTIENFDSKELIQKSWLYAAWEAINGVPLFTMEIRRVRDAGAKSWVMALALSGLKTKMKPFFFALSLIVFLPKPALAERWVTFWDMALTKEISEEYRRNGECRHSQIDLDSIYTEGNIAYYNKRHFYCS